MMKNKFLFWAIVSRQSEYLFNNDLCKFLCKYRHAKIYIEWFKLNSENLVFRDSSSQITIQLTFFLLLYFINEYA